MTKKEKQSKPSSRFDLLEAKNEILQGEINWISGDNQNTVDDASHYTRLILKDSFPDSIEVTEELLKIPVHSGRWYIEVSRVPDGEGNHNYTVKLNDRVDEGIFITSETYQLFEQIIELKGQNI